MLRPLPDLPPGVIGFDAVGELHSDDYRDVLRPAIEAAADAGPVHLVYVLGPEFSGYSAGATWEDTKLGLGHLTAFERTAVVTDVGWVEHLVSGFGWMVPGKLRRFPLAEQADAVRWAAGDDQPEPVAADGSSAEDGAPEATSPVVATQPMLGGPQTLTPRAPLAPGADIQAGLLAGAPPQPPAVPEQWAPDPSGRHQHRWWNGREWTEHVADNGVSSLDPLG